MGRKSAKTGGAAQLKPKPAAKSKKVESESEAESDASESFMQFKRGKKHDSDEEEDREVFNLAMNDDDSENEVSCMKLSLDVEPNVQFVGRY